MKEIKKQVLNQLYSIESKMKFNSEWDSAVSQSFNTYGVYNFEDLVGVDITEAQKLISKFGKVKSN